MLQNKKVSCSSRLGFVLKITDDKIAVNILNMSACAGCHASIVCSAFEQKEKIVYVPNTGQQVCAGDEVEVRMQTSMGLTAVALAYLLPLAVVVALLIVLSQSGMEEYLAGILALSSLGLYYLVIYLIRNRLKKQFSFYIEKRK